MLDAFGGTCVYDESGRHDRSGHGVLGFLFAGRPALGLGNLDREDLIPKVLDTLPEELRNSAREALIETRVHRWAMGVSAQPGGFPQLAPEQAHVPDRAGSPGLVMVGGHLFDSTLNAVLQSASFATDRVSTPSLLRT